MIAPPPRRRSLRPLNLSRYIDDRGDIIIGLDPPETSLRKAEALIAHADEIKGLTLRASASAGISELLGPLTAFLSATTCLETLHIGPVWFPRNFVDALVEALVQNRRCTSLKSAVFRVHPNRELVVSLFTRFWSSLFSLKVPTFSRTFTDIDLWQTTYLQFGGRNFRTLTCSEEVLALLLAALPRDADLTRIDVDSYANLALSSILRAVEGIASLRSIKFERVKRIRDVAQPSPPGANTHVKDLAFDRCTFLRANLPTSLGCFQDLESFFFRDSLTRNEPAVGMNEDRLDFGFVLQNNVGSLRKVTCFSSDLLLDVPTLLRSDECVLESIELREAGAEIEPFQHFCQAMEENESVRSLILPCGSSDGTRHAWMMTLCQSLGKWKGLVHLVLCVHSSQSLEYYKVRDLVVLRALEEAMRENESLTKLEWRPQPIQVSAEEEEEEDAELRRQLVESINFHVTLNSKGRRLLHDDNVPLNVWSLILENTARKTRFRPAGVVMRDLSSLFVFLKTKHAAFFGQAGRRGIVRGRET